MDGEWPALPVELTRSGARRPPPPELVARRAGLTSGAVERLGRLLAEGEPGVIVSTQVWAMEHLAQVPHDAWAVIGQYHSSMEAAAASGDLERVIAAYRDVDVVAMLTPSDAEAIRRLGLVDVTWLPNPLAFWPDAPAAAADTAVGYVGRLSHEKGVAFLVDAWARLEVRHPTWRLRVVGDGPDRDDLRARAADQGLTRIDWVGTVADPAAELARLGLLVQPSLTEGLPLALAEAMASGLACVATDCSAGVRLLTDDGRGAALVARGDAEALAEAVDALIFDPVRRADLGRRARVVAEPFRADHVIDRWEALLDRVLR
jgi:glycosyltransferase involved in cell wall biosynthesis